MRQPTSIRRNRHRQSERAAQLRLAAALIIAAVLAWFVVTVNLGQAAARQHLPERGLRMRSHAPQLLGQEAEQTYTAGDFADARTLAAQALTRQPTQPEALRTLALADQALGDPGSAAALMGQAAALGWRDEATQVWIGIAALQAGDTAAAAQRFDADARNATDPLPSLARLDTLLLAYPQLRPFMARRLALAPVWRQPYFEELTAVPAPALAVREALLIALSGTAAPPTRREAVAFVNEQVRRGDYRGAWNLWSRISPGIAFGQVFDGGFEHVESGTYVSPFEWRLGSAGSADGSLAPVPGHGTVFHIRADSDPSGIIARQLILAAPGRLVLSTRVGSAALADRLGWTLLCAHGASLLSVPVSSAPGGGAEVTRTVAFMVPPSCTAAYLTLKLGHADSGASVDSWIDDVHINR